MNINASILSSLILFGFQAQADTDIRCVDRGDRVVLRFFDAQITRGSLPLRRLINRYCGFTRLSATSVRLVAKSRYGRGQAILYTNRYSQSRFVDGNPSEWNNPSPYTYDRVSFWIPRGDQFGRLLLQFNGQFRIKRIVVFRGQGGGGGSLRVRCESRDYRYRNCYVGRNMRMARVSIERQLSNASCIRNRSWGVLSNSIWVDRGCAAIFRITWQRRNGGEEILLKNEDGAQTTVLD